MRSIRQMSRRKAKVLRRYTTPGSGAHGILATGNRWRSRGWLTMWWISGRGTIEARRISRSDWTSCPYHANDCYAPVVDCIRLYARMREENVSREQAPSGMCAESVELVTRSCSRCTDAIRPPLEAHNVNLNRILNTTSQREMSSSVMLSVSRLVAREVEVRHGNHARRVTYRYRNGHAIIRRKSPENLVKEFRSTHEVASSSMEDCPELSREGRCPKFSIVVVSGGIPLVRI